MAEHCKEAEILNAVDDIITVCDVETLNIKFVSKSVEKHLGYRTEEILGKKITEIFSESENVLNHFISNIPENGRLSSRETCVRKNGSPVTVHTVMVKTKLDNRECIIISIRDISKETFIEEKCRNTYRDLNLLYSFITELTGVHTEEEAYRLFADYVKKLGVEHIHLYRVTEKEVQSAMLTERENMWTHDCIEQNAEICKAIRSGLSVITSEGTCGCPLIQINDEVKSYMCVPIWVENNYTTTASAVFTLMSAKPDFFTEDVRKKVNKFAETLSPVISKIRFLEENRELSIRDSLTGVYNRRFLDELLKKEFHRAVRIGTKLSVIMIDVDDFKSFNDNYGHHTGDAVLKHFSSIVQKHIRASDTLARYGGEEFTVVLPETEKEQATITAERLRQILSETPLHIEKQCFHVTASFGIATFNDDAETVSELIKLADERLYRAKKQGKNRVVAT